MSMNEQERAALAEELVAKAMYEHDLKWVASPTAFKSWEETAAKDIYLGRATAAIAAHTAYLWKQFETEFRQGDRVDGIYENFLTALIGPRPEGTDE